MRISIWSSLLLVPLCLFGKIQYSIQDTYFQKKPSAFAPLSEEEKATHWGLEYQIGKGFAERFDLYRAITAFQRAEILTEERKAQIEYDILLSYYLGGRYKDLDLFFSKSSLQTANASFPAFHDLLVILYDTRMHLDQEETACRILEILQKNYPATYSNLLLFSLMQNREIERLKEFSHPDLDAIVSHYEALKKSPTRAALFNSLLPGLGYFYIGQVQTAITAVLINALFIWATIAFFRKRLFALGIFLLTFEIGWYGAGIYGAKGAANFYNERAYEEIAMPMMNHHKLFPIYQLEYGF